MAPAAPDVLLAGAELFRRLRIPGKTPGTSLVPFRHVVRRQSVGRAVLRGVEQRGYVFLQFCHALFQHVQLLLLTGKGLVELREQLFLKIGQLFQSGYLFFGRPVASRGRDERAGLIPPALRYSDMFSVTESSVAVSYRSGSVTFQGRPYLPSSSRKGSGSICSMFQTPGFIHFPVSIIIAPTMAGTPVV